MTSHRDSGFSDDDLPDDEELARREAIMRQRWDWDEWESAMTAEEVKALLKKRLDRGW